MHSCLAHAHFMHISHFISKQKNSHYLQDKKLTIELVKQEITSKFAKIWKLTTKFVKMQEISTKFAKRIWKLSIKLVKSKNYQ